MFFFISLVIDDFIIELIQIDRKTLENHTQTYTGTRKFIPMTTTTELKRLSA